MLSALSDSLILDTGASAVLLRQSALHQLSPFFTPSPVPPLSFDTPTPSTQLFADTGGTLLFPDFPHPITCYVLPDSQLSHSLLSVHALLGDSGTVTFTPSSVHFTSPASPVPYLYGTKSPTDSLWTLTVPSPPHSSISIPAPEKFVMHPLGEQGGLAASFSTGSANNTSGVSCSHPPRPVFISPIPTFTTNQSTEPCTGTVFFVQELPGQPVYTAFLANTVPTVRNIDDASFVAYAHRSFGSPSLSTFVPALRKGWIRIPRLTAKLAQRNPPHTVHTAFGHLDTVSKNLASHTAIFPKALASPATIYPNTRSQTGPAANFQNSAQANFETSGPALNFKNSAQANFQNSGPGPNFKNSAHANFQNSGPAPNFQNTPVESEEDSLTYDIPFALTLDRESWCAGDLTGRLTPPSRLGHEYILVTVYLGYIHLVPMISKSAKCYVRAYKNVVDFYRAKGHGLTHLTIDNEDSQDLKTFFTAAALTVQYVPPATHRANPAERAIRTAKNHIIALLSSLHPTFPADLWHKLMPQAELTLNHLRPWTPDPTKSAYHGLYGHIFDFRAHPIHPPGQLVVAHSPPAKRESWAHHGVRAFYLGPALSHYRCHHVYVVRTGSDRITDTLAHFPIPLFHFSPPDPIPPDDPTPTRPHPQLDGSDMIGLWFNEPELGICSIAAVAQPFELVEGAGNRTDDDYLPPGWHQCLTIRLPSGRTERCSVTEVARWYKACPHTPPPAIPQRPPPRPRTPKLKPGPKPASPPRAAPSTGVPPGVTPPAAPSTGAPPALIGLAHALPPLPPLPPGDLFAFAAAAILALPPALITLVPSSTPASAPRKLNLDSQGRPLTFQSALRGANRPHWIAADGTELVKLVRDTGTLQPRHSPTTTPTYYNRVVKEKPDASRPAGIVHRVRGTAGGDRVTVPYSCSSATASLPCVKLLFNAVVSEANSRFGTLDLTDYYLGSVLPSPESIKIYVATFSATLLDSLGLTPFIKTDPKGRTYIFFDIVKTMYGLPQAGLLSQLQLVSLLYESGYHQTSTPMLFRHATRDITFCLVVDDFGVKYSKIADLEHLVDCLSALYHVKSHPTGVQYLGFTVAHDRVARTLTLSYPGYIAKLLAQIRPLGVKAAASPAIYTPPNFGSRAPQLSHVDNSAPASAAEIKDLQIIVGSLLYYARAVDATMLPAVCALASRQSNPTAATMLAAERLLGYASSHQNNTLVLRASSMLLRIHSDGSYLSRPKSGSVAGGFHFLGDADPTLLNAPVLCHSTLIPVVVGAVSEAEYAAVYANAQHGVDERRILANLGYPQPPTPIFCDNECAVGLSNGTITQKKSKSMDMRFDWVKDRVRQLQFDVRFIPGKINLSDFFTKALPVHEHVRLAPVYATPSS